jgi:alkyl sulfatase BDS1-like metallo-beta-lactamase superfamily hydrolase
MNTGDATEYTKKANQLENAAPGLDWEDRKDEERANRGLIARLEEPVIRDDTGRAVWDLVQYSFLEDEKPPETVNPSLWRQARLNMAHGLFKVCDGLYQVRGHDLSVISFVRGKRGWIVIDPLISSEVAAASLRLVLDNVEDLPVTAVIYTHSHLDHFGGVKGVISQEAVDSGDAKVIAPEGFLEAAISENVMAGDAMSRRAAYMYGSLLPRGPRGQVDAALGKMTSSGSITLIEPTDSIKRTGEEMKIDGVDITFQVTPGTEAPAEMNFFFPGMRALCMAENCSHNLHNILTLRGAQVRDAQAWAHYLNEAIDLFTGDSDVVFTSHHWPVWGREDLREYMRKQRDMYRYLHDQTLRLMNKGLIGSEIAEELQLPPSLAREWYNRGYYGSVSHNVKAIYQRYLGWFSGNPADLNPLPPVDAGRKYVEYMGGADELLAKAKKAYDAGEYRWVAQVVNHLVFAQPDNKRALALQADALEQLGYQSENATWRNFYLTGAMELRVGAKPSADAPSSSGAADMVRALPAETVFDFLAIHLVPEKADGVSIKANIEFTDSGEKYVLELANCVLNHSSGRVAEDADVTMKLTHGVLAGMGQGEDMKAKLESGEIKIEGDGAKLGELFSLLDMKPTWFNIVTP